MACAAVMQWWTAHSRCLVWLLLHTGRHARCAVVLLPCCLGSGGGVQHHICHCRGKPCITSQASIVMELEYFQRRVTCPSLNMCPCLVKAAYYPLPEQQQCSSAAAIGAFPARETTIADRPSARCIPPSCLHGSLVSLIRAEVQLADPAVLPATALIELPSWWRCCTATVDPGLQTLLHQASVCCSSPVLQIAWYGRLDITAKVIFGFLFLLAHERVIADKLQEERDRWGPIMTKHNLGIMAGLPTSCATLSLADPHSTRLLSAYAEIMPTCSTMSHSMMAVSKLAARPRPKAACRALLTPGASM